MVALIGLVAASLVGGTVQFALLRSVARPAVLRLLLRFVAADRVERESERLRTRGAPSVAIARMTPGVRILAIAASALAGLPATAFLVGLTLGNAVFIAAHFGLGFVVGEPVLAAVGGALGPVAVAVVVLAVGGAAAWLILGRRGHFAGTIPTMTAWADACCPACLGLAAVRAID
jgi:membrane protein DedA with SNARE-associated domain